MKRHTVFTFILLSLLAISQAFAGGRATNSDALLRDKIAEAAQQMMPPEIIVKDVINIEGKLNQRVAGEDSYQGVEWVVEPLAHQLVGKVAARIHALKARRSLGSLSAILVLNRRFSKVIVVRDLTKGAVVTADNFRQVDVEADSLSEAPAQSAIAEIKPLLGKRAVRAMKAGQTVFESDFEKVPVILNRAHVRILIREGGVSAVVPAEAYQDGAVGDVIRVLNTLSNKMMSGRVIDAATVEVSL